MPSLQVPKRRKLKNLFIAAAGASVIGPAVAQADPVFTIVSPQPLGQSGPSTSRLGSFDVYVSSATPITNISAMQFEINTIPGVQFLGGTGADWSGTNSFPSISTASGDVTTVRGYETLDVFTPASIPAGTNVKMATINYQLDPGITGAFPLTLRPYDANDGLGSTFISNQIDPGTGSGYEITPDLTDGQITVSTPKLRIANMTPIVKSDTVNQVGSFDIVIDGPGTDVSALTYELQLLGGSGIEMQVNGISDGTTGGIGTVPSPASDYWTGATSPTPLIGISGGANIKYSDVPSGYPSFQGTKGVTHVEFIVPAGTSGTFDLDFLSLDESPFGVSLLDNNNELQPISVFDGQIVISDTALLAGILNVSVTPASSRVLVGQAASLTATLTNTGVDGTNDSITGLAVTGAVSGTSGATLAPGTGSATVSGNTAAVVAGNNTFTVNASGTNESIGGTVTGSGSVNVAGVNQRQFVSPDVINLGRVLVGSSISQNVVITTSGLHANTTDATLLAYSGAAIDGLNLSGGPNFISGANANNNIPRTMSGVITAAPGEIGGAFVIGANDELAGSVGGAAQVSFTGTAVGKRSLTAGVVNFGRMMVNTTGSGSAAVTSTINDHQTTSDAQLMNGSRSIGAYTQSGNGAYYDGTSAGGAPPGSVGLSRNFGPGVTGVQNETVTLTQANGALGAEFAGGVNDLEVSVTATPVANRAVTSSQISFTGVLRGAGPTAVQGSANLTTTGDDNHFTRITVNSTGTVDSGVGVTGGTGGLFASASDAAVRHLGGTFTGSTVNFGVYHGTSTLTNAGAEGAGFSAGTLPGQTPGTTSVGFDIPVGMAVADNTNSRSSFGGTVLKADVASGGSFAALSGMTSTSESVGTGGQGPIGTVATIRAGRNDTGGSQTVSMAWRTRNGGAEAEIAPGGTPPFVAPSWSLTSDVLRLTGMEVPGDDGDARRTEASPFVLEMTYEQTGDDQAESDGALAGSIFLSWLDPGADGAVDVNPGGDDRWVNATIGNLNNVATSDMQNYLADPDGAGPLVAGSWDAFAAQFGVNDGNLADFVGAWGVDITSNTVWAVLDHNSDFAAADVSVVPEPSGLALLAGGALGLVGRRRRRRA